MDLPMLHSKGLLMRVIWSSGRLPALELEGPAFESWFHQVNLESLEKNVYIPFLT